MHRKILNDGTTLSSHRTNVPRGENLTFICSYIFANPGCKVSQVKRALIEARGYEYSDELRGKYSSYFYDYYSRKWYYDKLWSQVWINANQTSRSIKHCFLRSEGMARVDLDLAKRLSNNNNVPWNL